MRSSSMKRPCSPFAGRPVWPRWPREMSWPMWPRMMSRPRRMQWLTWWPRRLVSLAQKRPRRLRCGSAPVGGGVSSTRSTPCASNFSMSTRAPCAWVCTRISEMWSFSRSTWRCRFSSVSWRVSCAPSHCPRSGPHSMARTRPTTIPSSRRACWSQATATISRSCMALSMGGASTPPISTPLGFHTASARSRGSWSAACSSWVA
mmetsp:Transcript_65249/g.199597  ORF Transcript_65249/g.199597 Transcript_65249/m.199597 type:complete len:204 (-) Transcript_65249:116-727(-)